MADSRINVYHSLSVMLNAGMPITRALQSVHKSGRFGRVFTEVEQGVSRGNSLTDIIQKYPAHFKKLDVTLIRTGEETGQLAEMLEELSRWYSFRQRINRALYSGMVYPILMIHALAVLAPVVPFALSGFEAGTYVRGLLTILGIFYIPAALILAIKMFAPKQGSLRRMLDVFVIRLPIVGKAVRELELSRFARVFAVTYRAGIPIVRCCEMAAGAVSNTDMLARLEGAGQKARLGQEMSLGFGSQLPLEFISLWKAGEESGMLDDSAWRLSAMHAENAERRFAVIAQWTPRLVYVIVACVMIYYIFKGYSQIYGNLL